MTLGNFTGGFFFYILAKKDLDLTNFNDILAERFKISACKKRGIDLETHAEQIEEIGRIEDELSIAYSII
jgi:hypothetical protein